MSKVQKYKTGQKFHSKSGTYIRIMAFSEGYYMARWKGCSPFCYDEKELEARLKTL